MDFPEVILAAGELGWTTIAFSVGLMLALVVLSASFSGSETVLFSLSPVQIERAAASRSPFRRLVAGLMRRPTETLTVVLVANTAVNVLLFAVSYVLSRYLAHHAGAWVTPAFAAGSVLLVVVCGEVVPKVLAVRLADRLAAPAALLVRTVGVVALPLGRLINWVLVEPVVRLAFGGRARLQPATELSRVELKALLEMSRRRGTLRPLEDTFLRAVIDLGHTRVHDVMVPRVEMAAYDLRAGAEGLRELMRRTHHKKVPVYEGSLDRLVGVVYAKVLFLNPGKPLASLVQPVRFVPELITCEQLLVHFRQTRTQLAIAVDEYGGVAGLVTLEDVLEQIVGELHDPEDAPQQPDLRALANGEYDISGQLSVQYWAETFGLPPRVERVATVGGLVMAQLGRPARVGDVVRLGNVELRVTQMRRRRIDRLHLRLLDDADREGAAP
ncbi:MAG: hemolysin family protein [Planctomycetota bacterium]